MAGMGREKTSHRRGADYDDSTVTEDLFIKPWVLVSAIYSESEPDTSDEAAEANGYVKNLNSPP